MVHSTMKCLLAGPLSTMLHNKELYKISKLTRNINTGRHSFTGGYLQVPGKENRHTLVGGRCSVATVPNGTLFPMQYIVVQVGPTGLWSNVVHDVVNRVLSGIHPLWASQPVSLPSSAATLSPGSEPPHGESRPKHTLITSPSYHQHVCQGAVSSEGRCCCARHSCCCYSCLHILNTHT